MSSRKHYSPEEKVRIVKDYLVEKKSSAEIKNENGVDRSMLCRWVEQLFDGAGEIYSRKSDDNGTTKKIAEMEGRIYMLDGGCRAVFAALIEEKKAAIWGDLNGQWVEGSVRDEVVDFIKNWQEILGYHLIDILRMVGIGPAKFYEWRRRYGEDNRHSQQPPRDPKLVKVVMACRKDNPDATYKELVGLVVGRGFKVSVSTVRRIVKDSEFKEMCRLMQLSN